ncbi:MAG: metallophosphoesterase [Clostridia bacterium]|nr:metallophosphoesterase [Clostridia bacterium]
MKKGLSMVLAVVMLIGLCTAVPVSAEPIGWEVHDEVDLRVGVMNDTHMRNADQTDDIVNHILDSQMEIANGKIDGMALVGDVTFYNTSDDCSDIRHYQNMYASINEKVPGAPILYAMGNHEFPFGVYDDETSAKAHAAFVKGTGQPLNDHKIFGDGYHFIAVAPKSATSELSAETKNWAMQEIENAIGSASTNSIKDENGNYSFPEGEVPDSTKPVFVLIHAPLPGTVLWGSEGGNVKEFVSYLKTRPQVVVVNGHLHVSAYIPSTIWQDGFTAFQGSINDGHYITDKAFSETYTGADAHTHQGSMIEVDDGVVKIYRLDYDNNEEIGEPWTIDIPQIVKNLRDDNPDNDGDAYLYSNEKRANITSTAQFPEGTELDVKALQAGCMVTYPNTAYMTSYDEIQQDNFIRGYKVEAVSKEGFTAATVSHQTDYYLKPENRKASYTKELAGLEAGKTYTINVYPVMPLGLYGSLGTPISAEVTMPEDETKNNAIRYEIEDYCPEAKLNKASLNASGGGICISAQGGLVPGSTQLSRPADDVSPFTFDFEIDLPIDGKYNIEYGVGYRSSGYLSKVTLTLDDTIVIGDNMKRGDIDRSLGGTYPWDAHIPLYSYYAQAQTLTAGKHKVTVTVDLPETTAKKQPYLFCADYIEFNPTTVVVDLSAKTRIEFEKYASEVSIEETDGTPAGAFVNKSAQCSGGAFLVLDTVDQLAVNDTETFSIPLYVQNEGYYKMSYVDCRGIGPIDIYLDSLDSTPLNSGFTATQNTNQDADGNYTYFGIGWAVAQQHSGSAVYLPEGKHELIIELHNRKGKFNDFASYLDYLEFTPVTRLVSPGEETLIEFENFKDEFTPTVPEVRTFDAASGGLFAASGYAGKETVTLDIPVCVAETGTYRINAGIGQAGQLSLVSLLKNGEELLYTFSGENAKQLLYEETHYVLRQYVFDLELEKGLQTLTFSMAPRNGWEGSIAYALDYFHFVPDVDGIVNPDKPTRIEFENVVPKIESIVQSDGSVITHTNGTVYTIPTPAAKGCSGGRYAILDTPDGQAVDKYYDIPVLVKVNQSGYYNMEYVSCGNLPQPVVYMDSESNNISGSQTKLIDEKDEEGLDVYFGMSWSTAAIFHKTVYLEKGTHTVYFRTYARSGSFLDYAQCYDYVDFAPVDSFTVSDGVATANVTVNQAVTGKAILALYNGGRLVGTGEADAVNTRTISVTAPANDAVTHAKVMVWSDLATGKPIVDAKELKAQ